MSHTKKIFTKSYQDSIALENLLEAWKHFQKGKRKKKDVQLFEYRLMQNLLTLHTDLRDKTYTHGGYRAFKVNDPKSRDIHKACVRDRVLHHLLYQTLSPFYFPLFIHDSYSCQDNKGAHKAIRRFQQFGSRTSKNHTSQVWVLKCDIKKFFASIDQATLMEILKERIMDEDILWLLYKVIESFDSRGKRESLSATMRSFGRGLPLGNLTSQLLVNIYMHEFDQYMKQTLKVKYYIRYADDFVVLSQDREYLIEILAKMKTFLEERLKLELHPNKVSLKTLGSGVDFLGWVHFPRHRVLRTTAKKRMVRKITERNKDSYLGMLGHGDARKLSQSISFGAQFC